MAKSSTAGRVCLFLLFSLMILDVQGLPGPLKQAFSRFKAKGERLIASITAPIGRSFVSSLLQNCTSLKNFLGVTYERLMVGDPEPGYEVKIDMWNISQKITFNVEDAKQREDIIKSINSEEPVFIFLHGFLSSSESEAALKVTESLTAKGFNNVLALDCSDFVRKYYVRSSTCIRFIGEHLGMLLVDIVKNGVFPDNIHIIGHSLGSHIAGFAGKTFKEVTGSTIGRISGLDPAGPCFIKEEDELKLNKNDATFVDVIHSDAGILGLNQSIGHVDFYPNGGASQPGCLIIPCSHSRAWELYSESIASPTSFMAVRCNSWLDFCSGNCDSNKKNMMGYGVERKALGTFFLRTSRKEPFAMLEEGIKHYVNKVKSHHSRGGKRRYHKELKK